MCCAFPSPALATLATSARVTCLSSTPEGEREEEQVVPYFARFAAIACFNASCPTAPFNT